MAKFRMKVQSEALRDIKQGWRSEKIINSPNPSSGMSSAHNSPSHITLSVDNVQMDRISDSEAKQAARNLHKPRNRLRHHEATGRRWEEWKRLEEEEAQRVVEREQKKKRTGSKRGRRPLERRKSCLEMNAITKLQVSTRVLRTQLVLIVCCTERF